MKFLHVCAWLVPTLGLAGLTAGALATGGARRAPRAHPKAPAKVKAAATVTYARNVVPVLYRNCTACHRTGEVAPFTLSSYADARKRARQIALVTSQRLMPPWKADSHGEFQDERRLTDAQIALLQQWADRGAPKGNPAQEPSAPRFLAGWALGTPDLIVTPPRAYTVAADGRDVYRCYVIPTDFPEDRYVSAVDVLPGNRAVVHHALVYVDTSGTARKLEAKSADGSPGYQEFGGIGFLPAGMLGGWAPGAMPRRLPADTGILLPKGADIVLEVHYHKDGKPETDHTQVALYFNKEQIARPLHILPLANTGLHIPAGDKDYDIRASLPVLLDTTLPAGSRIDLVAHYDNSEGNPRNPSHPPKLVSWGEQTTDEMCLCYLGFTIDAEHAPRQVKTSVLK